MSDIKKVDSYDQDIKNENYNPEQHNASSKAVVFPASLENLSQEELAAVNKRVTRKIDIYIMREFARCQVPRADPR
jgi:hypothetical protein